MPYKDREKQLEAQRKHYQDNKKKYRKNINKRKERNREYIHELKKNGCSKCGYNEHPECLEFHHLVPSKKNGKFENLSFAIRHKWKLEKIDEEVSKCILLCANCHRLLHALEKDYGVSDNAIRKWARS